MRNGWYVDEATEVVVEQEMHRKVKDSDSAQCTPPMVCKHVRPCWRFRILFGHYALRAQTSEEWDLPAHTFVHYILPTSILILQGEIVLSDGNKWVNGTKRVAPASERNRVR
jgi:hypothetical protein